jgi:hypothetical protein
MTLNTYYFLAAFICFSFLSPHVISAQTASTTEHEIEDKVELELEEIRGVLEGVGADILPITVKNDDGTLGIRRVQYGNKDAIRITRDKKQVTLTDLQPADAVVVNFSTNITYKGVVSSSTKSDMLSIRTTDGRDISFVPGKNLEIRYLHQRNAQAEIYATASGSSTIPVIQFLEEETPITVTVLGESIVSIDAYSSGIIPGTPRDQQVIQMEGMTQSEKILLLVLVIFFTFGGIFFIIQKKKKML